MSDPIDRQEAIDMFQNLAYDDWNQGLATTWADALSEAARMIRDLPSAQPQIIRCKDCKHYENAPDDDNRGWCNANDCVFRPTDFCSLGERRTDG